VDTPGVVRPLGFGELLDRAITIVVQRFGFWVVTFAIVLVPLGVCQAFASNGAAAIANDVQTALQSGGDAKAFALALAFRTHMNAADAAQYAILLLAHPLVVAAAIYAASRAYDRANVTLRDALVFGMRRWPRLMVVFVIALVLFALAGVLLAVALAFGVPLVSDAYRHGKTAVAIGSTIAGCVGTAAVLLIGFAVHGVAMCTVVVENVNPFVAIGRAAARVLRGTEPLRALLVGLALAAMLTAASAVGLAVGALAFGVTHLSASVALSTTVVAFFSSSLYYVVITCYYRDVRLRRDGADLLEGIAA
jgi:uncharacterized membrane protein